MLTLSSLGRDTILYGVATLLRYSTNLVLLPIYTSTLTTSEYGALETIVVSAQTLMIVVNFGLSNAVLRFFADCKDERSVGVMIRTAMLAVLLLSSLMFLLSFPFLRSVSVALLKDAGRTQLLTLAFAWSIGGALNEQLFAYFRARRNVGTYVVIAGVQFLLLTGLIFFLMTRLNAGIAGVLYANILVVWLLNLWLLRFWSDSTELSRQWLRVLLAFGLPLILSRLSWLILNSADRYFIAYYRDLSEVGLYSLGYKVGLMVQIGAIVPFQLGWAPFVFARFAEEGEDAKPDYAKAFTYMVLLFIVAAVTVYLFAPELVHFLGSAKLNSAISVVPFVLVAYFFNAIYYWSASLFHLKNRTGLLSIIIFVMAGICIALNWVATPIWGWRAAAMITVLTVGGAGLTTFLIGQRLFPIRLENGRLAKILIVAIIAVLMARSIGSQIAPVYIAYKTIILASIPLALLILRFFTLQERHFAQTLLKSLANTAHPSGLK